MYPDPAFESVEQLRKVVGDLQDRVRGLERDIEWMMARLAHHDHYEQGYGR